MKNNDIFVEKYKYEFDVWDDDDDVKFEWKRADKLYFVFNVFHDVHELSCFPHVKNTSYFYKNKIFKSIISNDYLDIPFKTSPSIYFILSINNTNNIPPSFYVKFVLSFSQ